MQTNVITQIFVHAAPSKDYIMDIYTHTHTLLAVARYLNIMFRINF